MHIFNATEKVGLLHDYSSSVRSHRCLEISKRGYPITHRYFLDMETACKGISLQYLPILRIDSRRYNNFTTSTWTESHEHRLDHRRRAIIERGIRNIHRRNLANHR